MNINNLNISFGSRIVFKDFSIEFPDNTISCILGPSGCGKTTLLKAIASGTARTGTPREETSFIFQEPRLIPWCTLEKNLELVLKNHCVSIKETKDRARNYLDRVGLFSRLHSFPGQLSGGERQRAAIARAFAFPSTILLMDEPFQSQDYALKVQLSKLVRKIQQDERRTIIAVTHDIREAISLSDSLYLIAGTPVELLHTANSSTPGLEHTVTEIMQNQPKR